VWCFSLHHSKNQIFLWQSLKKVLKEVPFLSFKERDIFKKDIQFMREKKEELEDKWD